MSIQLNPVDLRGLAGVAQGNANLNIQPTGALGLQAAQISGAQRNAALDRQQQGSLQLRQQNLLRDQMAQQGLLAQQNQQLDQQKMAQQAAQFGQSNQLAQQQLAQQGQLGQGQLAVQQQDANMKQQQIDMAKLADLKKDDLMARGGFAAYGVLAMKNAKTPEEAQQIRTAILKEALSKGYITDVEAKQGAAMPLSQYQAAQAGKLMQYGVANDFKDFAAAMAPKAPANGLTSITRADGSVETYSPLTKPNTTTAQQDVMFSNDNSAELHQLYDKVPDSFFGTSALKQSGTFIREWAQNIPIIGNLVSPNKADKEQLSSYSGLNGASEMLAMKVIKQLSGVQYSDKQLEFMKEIIPSVGPGTVRSVFEGKSQNLFRMYDAIKQNREALISQGILVGSPQYEKAMLNTIQSIVSSQQSIYSPDAIAAEMKRRGLK